MALLSVAALILIGASAVFSMMKSSGAYKEALALARADCEVQETLGAPISPGWMVSGSVNVSGPSGRAELSTSLRGTREAGRLYVTATKTAGRWQMDVLEFAVPPLRTRINLLAKGRRRCV